MMLQMGVTSPSDYDPFFCACPRFEGRTFSFLRTLGSVPFEHRWPFRCLFDGHSGVCFLDKWRRTLPIPQSVNLGNFACCANVFGHEVSK